MTSRRQFFSTKVKFYKIRYANRLLFFPYQGKIRITVTVLSNRKRRERRRERSRRRKPLIYHPLRILDLYFKEHSTLSMV